MDEAFNRLQKNGKSQSKQKNAIEECAWINKQFVSDDFIGLGNNTLRTDKLGAVERICELVCLKRDSMMRENFYPGGDVSGIHAFDFPEVAA